MSKHGAKVRYPMLITLLRSKAVGNNQSAPPSIRWEVEQVKRLLLTAGQAIAKCRTGRLSNGEQLQ